MQEENQCSAKAGKKMPGITRVTGIF